MTFIARQRIRKQASTLERLFFLRGACREVIKDKEDHLSCCQELGRVLEMAAEDD
jgi:hypothetical protein